MRFRTAFVAACVARGAAALSTGATLRTSPGALARPALLSLRAGSSAAMTGASPVPDKLASLRAEMARAGVGALVVPSGDAHLSEYVHPHYDRRAFISDFTGSAGTALVTADVALLWTDGRYFIQAENELGAEWSLMRSGDEGVPTLQQWVAQNLAAGTGVGIDPSVFSTDEAVALDTALQAAKRDLSLVPMVGLNLVDAVWEGSDGAWPRVAAPGGPARGFPLSVAGVSREEKLAAVSAVRMPNTVFHEYPKPRHITHSRTRSLLLCRRPAGLCTRRAYRFPLKKYPGLGTWNGGCISLRTDLKHDVTRHDFKFQVQT